MKVRLTVRVGTVLYGLRVRNQRLIPYLNEASTRIAARTNGDDGVIASIYPGAVAQSIMAMAEPSKSGGHLFAVRLRELDPLFGWYEYGTAPHIEIGNPRMVFFWLKTNQLEYFALVHHPGYQGKHNIGLLRRAVTDIAREEWKGALQEALQTPAS